MNVLLALAPLAALLVLAAPAAAEEGVHKEVCSPYLAFIHPNPPVVCAGVDYDAVNDFCVHAADTEECVEFVGPVIW